MLLGMFFLHQMLFVLRSWPRLLAYNKLKSNSDTSNRLQDEDINVQLLTNISLPDKVELIQSKVYFNFIILPCRSTCNKNNAYLHILTYQPFAEPLLQFQTFWLIAVQTDLIYL